MNTRKLPPSIVRVVLLFVVTIVCGEPIFGQAAARPNRGAMPTGSYSVSDIENISLTNGNLNLGIALASLPPVAGGKLGMTVRAEYNSKSWDTVRTERQADPLDAATKYVTSSLQLSDVGGWRVGAGYSISFEDATADYSWLAPPPNDPEYNLITQNRWTKVVLTMPDGAKHELRPVDYFSYGDGYLQHNHLRGYYKDNPNTVNGPVRYYSFDGSHIWAKIDPNPNFFYGVAQSWTLYLPDGTKVEQLLNGIQRITDNNGNKIEIFTSEETPGVFIQHYQDEQTGRDIRITYDPAGNGGEGVNYVKYQTVGGSWVTIDINYGTTHIYGKRYEFGDPECGDAADFIDTQMTVIRSIVYPQTEPVPALPRKFTFTYNSDTIDTVNYPWRPVCGVPYETVTSASHGWGSLSQIEMPTGAKVNYTYSLDDQHYLAINPDAAPREGMNVKTLTHDGTEDSWQYGNSPATGGVTGPDGSFVAETRYSSDPGFAHTNSGFGGKEELVYRTNNSNKVMVERHWTLMRFSGGENIAPGAAVFVAFNPVVDAEYTSLLDDSPNHNPVKMSAKTYQHDFNGNVIQTTEYDWFDPGLISRDAQGVPTGVPGGATVLRVTYNSYHNPATASFSENVYAKRPLSGATPRILNALKETITGPAITQLTYDEQAYDTPPTAGNLTSQRLWDNVDNKWITSSQTYDLYGNLVSKTDPRGKLTQFTYSGAHPLPTLVTVDPQNGTGTQESSTIYDLATGLVTSQTDPNGNVTNIDYTNQLLPPGTIDPFGRPGLVQGPLVSAGGVNQRHHTKTLYEDSSRIMTVMSDLNTEGDGLLKTQVLSDKLGRTIESRQFETATSYIAVRKTYDTANRISKTSNPFRSGETILWTTAVADLLGRVVSITTPDSAVVGTVYDSNTVTVTDQAGKSRKSVSDALGRLIQVYEDPGGLNHLTSYDYDVFGNLLHVDQHPQTRTFTYDSLSRLRSAFNPESGTISYSYDDNGNLTQKRDARLLADNQTHVTTTYIYDALNRPTSRSYNDGTSPDFTDRTPAVNYTYDAAIVANGKGRLTSVTSSVSSYSYIGYDSIGRILGGIQTIGSQPYPIGYSYDLAGHAKRITYPSGRTVDYSYDLAGRTSGFGGKLGDDFHRSYSSEMNYSSLSGMTKEKFGTDTAVYNKLYYNSRGQLAEIRATTSDTGAGDTTWDRGKFINWYSQGLQCGGPTCNAGDNNGNLAKQETLIPNAASWSQLYDYDNLNRLQRVKEYNSANTQLWQQEYIYDPFGNRTIHQANTWNPPGEPAINKKEFTVNIANNRLGVPVGQSGTMTYDNAGNLTTDTYSGGGLTRAYDAENRMTQETRANNFVASYGYDGDGRRVKRSTAVIGQPSSVLETWQIYGIGGELLAEYPANGPKESPQKEYGYRNGQLLITATVTAAGWGPPPVLDDNPLNPPGQPKTDVKAIHYTQLRTAINALRSHYNLSDYQWQKPAASNGAINNTVLISWEPIDEMRTALDQALGAPSPAYSPGLAMGQPIQKDHIQELRDRVLAAWNSGAGGVDIRWLVADHLGTPRMIIDQTGSLAGVKRHDYLPFGEELTTQGLRSGMSSYSGDNVRQKFTSKERDIETGLDYFGARYFASLQGRFTGADPYDINFERQEIADSEEANTLFTEYIGQPQHWNRYTYALNNPLKYVDPDGRKDEEHLVVLLDNQKFKITISDKIDKKERETILQNIKDAITKINGATALTSDEKIVINSLKGINVTNEIPYSHMDPGSRRFMILPHRAKTSTLDGLTADIIHESRHADQKRRGKEYNGLDAEMDASGFALGVFGKVGVTDRNTIKTYERDAKKGHYPPGRIPKSRAPNKRTP